MADEFKYGSDKNVVVALEHNVLMVNKKDLLKVNKACCERPGVLRLIRRVFPLEANACFALDPYEAASIEEPVRQFAILSSRSEYSRLYICRHL